MRPRKSRNQIKEGGREKDRKRQTIEEDGRKYEENPEAAEEGALQKTSNCRDRKK